MGRVYAGVSETCRNTRQVVGARRILKPDLIIMRRANESAGCAELSHNVPRPTIVLIAFDRGKLSALLSSASIPITGARTTAWQDGARRADFSSPGQPASADG